MQTKNILVSFLTIVSVLLLASTVSADFNPQPQDGVYTIDMVEVNDIVVFDGYNEYQAPVTAGETAKVEVWFTFTGAESDTDVTVKATIDTGKKEASDISGTMVVENDDRKKVTLNVEVPYELKDELSDLADLTIEIEGKDFEKTKDFLDKLNVERAPYDVNLRSVTIKQTITAGETFPVDIVLSNIGYTDLDDVYVTVRIPALDIETTSFFGDLVSLEDCDSHNHNSCDDEDDTDTASGRLLMDLPFDAPAGVYTLEVEVSNDDFETSVVKQFIVENDFSNTVIVSAYKKTVATGEDAEYELLIVNPTDNVKVYRIVTENSGDLSTQAKETVVAVPAGSSKSVTILASAQSEGDYTFDVSVFSGEELVETVTLNLSVEGKTATADLTVILTVILAIIFIVLLVVLIVLIGKKPAKTEEFGESYY